MYLNRILTGITLTDRSSPTPRVARDAAHVTCSADVHLGTGHETYETFNIRLGFVLFFECYHSPSIFCLVCILNSLNLRSEDFGYPHSSPKGVASTKRESFVKGKTETVKR